MDRKKNENVLPLETICRSGVEWISFDSSFKLIDLDLVIGFDI